MPETSELGFTPQEYDRRLRGAQEVIDRLQLDALLLFDPCSICYLSGFTTVNLWDTACLIVTRHGEPVTVFGQFESERFRASSRFRTHEPYPPGSDCVGAVVAALGNLGLLRGALGLEISRYLHAGTLAHIKAALGDAAVIECSNALSDLRRVKSDEEIAVLRRAAALTDEGILAAKAALREGAVDHEICAETTRALLAGGSEFMCIQPIVAVGPRTGMAHSTTAGCKVRSGDPVFLEIGASIHRYTAPLMRTLLPATASDELAQLAELSSRTLDAMIARMRPGVRASDVARAGEQVLGPALSRIAFHFVWGYSVGIGFPPSWLEETGFLLQPGNDRELRRGMVFHLPMMLRIPGICGAGSSETVLVTKNGGETLSQLPRGLTI